MIDSYKERIESGFLSFAGKASDIRKALYKDLTVSVLYAFCKGLKDGLASDMKPPNLEFYEFPHNPIIQPTKKELKVIITIQNDIGLLGYSIGVDMTRTSNGILDLNDMVSTVGFLAKKLECAEYSAAAIDKMKKQDSKLAN